MSFDPQIAYVTMDKLGHLCALNVYPWHEAIGDIPGARFEGRAKQKHWKIPPTPAGAAQLLTILAGTGAKVSSKAAALAREGFGRADARTRLLDERRPLLDLPYHDWLRTDPWVHQKRGISFLREFSAAAIGAGMGSGKSLMAVGAMNARNFSKVLIVSPSAALGVFPREFRLHSRQEWHTENGVRRTRTGTLKKLSLQERWALCVELYRCDCGRPHAAIVSYDALVKGPLPSADLAALGVELALFDEFHRLKGAGTAMSNTAASWVTQVPHRWGMSGTLLPQSPDDIYGEYRALDPAIFGTNHTTFRTQFIVLKEDEDSGRKFPVGVHRHARLEYSKRLHSIAYIPVVDLRLPPVTNSIRSFELEPEARRLYDKLRDEGVAEISAATAAAGGEVTPDGDERTVSPKNEGVALLRWAQITGGSITDDDGVTTVVSTAKAKALVEVFAEVGCRPGGRDGESRPEPVVVFCRFRPDLAAIRTVTEKAGLRYREISGARKDGLDDEAKMAPDCDVVGVQIQAGSEAIDLTRARVVVWYSVGWELWRYLQGKKRVHRPGQTRSVLNIYLIAEATIDGIIFKALAKKQNVVEAAIDAYLKHEGDLRSAELPSMDEGEGAAASGGKPVLPSWLLTEGQQPPRHPADTELDAEAAALAAAGMGGL